MRTLILVRYGEIYLKGLNRPYFMHALVERVKQAARPFGGRVWLHDARIFVRDMTDTEGCMDAVRRVFGVHSLCPAVEMEKTDFAAVCHEAASLTGRECRQVKVGISNDARGCGTQDDIRNTDSQRSAVKGQAVGR